MRAGLIDEYAVVTHPVLVGGGTPFFTALDGTVSRSEASLDGLTIIGPDRLLTAWDE